MSTDLWKLVCHILRNHIKHGHSCKKTVNRLGRKGASEPRPAIRELEGKLYREDWDLDRLWSLIPPSVVTDLEPESEGSPLVVMRWKGREFRIDGRQRTNQLKRWGKVGPHPIIVLDIGGS